jgi:transcriptional regulator with XRE-family HTH domain
MHYTDINTEVLKVYMKFYNLSQCELGELIGVSQQAISLYLKDKRKIPDVTKKFLNILFQKQKFRYTFAKKQIEKYRKEK